jgi:hypothetical protein
MPNSSANMNVYGMGLPHVLNSLQLQPSAEQPHRFSDPLKFSTTLFTEAEARADDPVLDRT